MLRDLAEGVAWQRVNEEDAPWVFVRCQLTRAPFEDLLGGYLAAGLPQAAYTASKAGLLGLTRDLAQQWGGRKGIRVNAVAPGFFITEMTEQYRPGYLDEQLRRTPFARAGEAGELTTAVLFLASDAGSYVTGQTLVVDGGLSLA